VKSNNVKSGQNEDRFVSSKQLAKQTFMKSSLRLGNNRRTL